MKFGLLLTLMLISLQALALPETCDLSANDSLVREINDRFDRGEMRGEDHAVAMKMLYIQRLENIIACVEEDKVRGITKAELQDSLDHQAYSLKIYLEEMNESIRINLENDRVGMATELMMERDQHVLEVRNLQDKIRNLIKEM